MSIRDWLSAPKTLDKVTDAIIAGGDKLMLTDQERIKYDQKGADIHLRLTEAIGNESTPTAISRRIMALLCIGPYVFLMMGSALWRIPGELLESQACINLATEWHSLGNSGFSYLAGIAVMFYLGKHVAGAFGKK